MTTTLIDTDYRVHARADWWRGTRCGHAIESYTGRVRSPGIPESNVRRIGRPEDWQDVTCGNCRRAG